MEVATPTRKALIFRFLWRTGAGQERRHRDWWCGGGERGRGLEPKIRNNFGQEPKKLLK